MRKLVKIIVNNKIPGVGLFAHTYQGQELMVHEHYSGKSWVIAEGKDVGGTISKEYAEIITMFKPESGMIFVTMDDRMGLFIQSENKLIMYYNNDGTGYTTWRHYYPSVLKGDCGDDIKTIYPGMAWSEGAGLNTNKRRESIVKQLPLWSRVSNKIVLNAKYTAAIVGDQVKVGCESFPLSKIQEILDVAAKLNKE